jgi:hypothetical protein
MVKRLRSRWFQLFKAFQPFKTINTGIRHEARGNRQKLIVPDAPHHVVQRGVCRMDVFFSANSKFKLRNERENIRTIETYGEFKHDCYLWVN